MIRLQELGQSVVGCWAEEGQQDLVDAEVLRVNPGKGGGRENDLRAADGAHEGQARGKVLARVGFLLHLDQLQGT